MGAFGSPGDPERDQEGEHPLVRSPQATAPDYRGRGIRTLANRLARWK